MAGNWKMHKTVGESVALVEQLREALAEVTGREILVCPPFTALYAVAQTLQESNIKVGAQNLYPAEQGAYTGETSPKMILDVGCSHVILGHSERRQYFQESDQFVNEKLKVALEYG
ncbi:MAG TPA: triose-phosphate isomerase, partial [Anaerolineae bacterium]|nr:triose-phosphate isomerase [Anaerolineae bacterium]